MKVKKFNEIYSENDPYGEEIDDDLFIKPEMLDDPDRIVPLYLYMEKTMKRLENEDLTLQENFTDIYDNVFHTVVQCLYGDAGIEFIKKAWDI